MFEIFRKFNTKTNYLKRLVSSLFSNKRYVLLYLNDVVQKTKNLKILILVLKLNLLPNKVEC